MAFRGVNQSYSHHEVLVHLSPCSDIHLNIGVVSLLIQYSAKIEKSINF